MHANGASAFGTGPSHFFIFNKFSYAQFIDSIKIFYHAHIVFSPISLIQMSYSVTRK